MMAVGLAEETLFFRGLLDKLQVKPLPSLRGEYKNGYNFLTHKGYSKAHREASQAWLNSCMKQVVGDVASARGLSNKQVLLPVPVPASHPHLCTLRSQLQILCAETRLIQPLCAVAGFRAVRTKGVNHGPELLLYTFSPFPKAPYASTYQDGRRLLTLTLHCF